MPSASRCPQLPVPTPVVLDCFVGVPPAQLHPDPGSVVVVVPAATVVVVLPSGIGSVGIGIVGIGTWASCTSVLATAGARPKLSPRAAKLRGAARRRTKAGRTRMADLIVTPPCRSGDVRCRRTILPPQGQLAIPSCCGVALG